MTSIDLVSPNPASLDMRLPLVEPQSEYRRPLSTELLCCVYILFVQIVFVLANLMTETMHKLEPCGINVKRFSNVLNQFWL